MARGRWIGALAALAVMAVAGPAQAQKPLFAEDGEIAFTLNAPFERFTRQARNGVAPVDGTIALGAQTFPLQIAPRGFTRRTGGICVFPPIKLDLDKPAMQGTLFEGQGKLKLVVQCRPQDAYEQMLIREYTVYRLYQALTPQSFRVRLASVTYHDTEASKPDQTRLGFLIEDGDDMAKRNGLTEIEVGGRDLSSSQIDSATLVRFALFQWLVGNLDWEYFAGPVGDTCCHNGKLIAGEGATTGLIPVPYDFDFSALVDAPYAAPPEGIRVRNAYERFYRGHCRANDQVPAVVAQLQAKRATFAQIIASEPRLNAASKREMQDYLDGSYAILGNPDRLGREITNHCR